MTRSKLIRGLSLVLAISLLVFWNFGLAEAKMRLKVSHQFAEGDVRDRMCRELGDRVSKRTNDEITFRYYPAKSLFKPREQWDAMKKGALDLSLFPVDYASGKVPQFSITLMPCAVNSLPQAMSWRNKAIGKKVEKLMEDNGVKLLVWFWLDGGIGSTERMIKVPEDVKGLKMRAAGKKFEFMLREAGSSITSMPSSEIYHALSTGVLNSCLTSTASFVSYRLYEQLKFLNAPKEYSIWYMLEPVCISMKTWNRLSPEQQKIFEEEALKLEAEWIPEAYKHTTEGLINAYSKAGVKLHYMTKEEFNQWLEIAQKSAWEDYAKNVEGGRELLELALEAMK